MQAKTKCQLIFHLSNEANVWVFKLPSYRIQCWKEVKMGSHLQPDGSENCYSNFGKLSDNLSKIQCIKVLHHICPYTSMHTHAYPGTAINIHTELHFQEFILRYHHGSGQMWNLTGKHWYPQHWELRN